MCGVPYIEHVCRAPGGLSWLTVQLLISPPVMILQFMSSSPTPGSVLTTQSLLGILSLPLSLLLPNSCMHTLFLKINKLKKKRLCMHGDFCWLARAGWCELGMS